MDKIKRFFDFSTTQLQFLCVLCVTALLMGGYLLIHNYAVPGAEADPLPVFLADGDEKYT